MNACLLVEFEASEKIAEGAYRRLLSLVGLIPMLLPAKHFSAILLIDGTAEIYYTSPVP